MKILLSFLCLLSGAMTLSCEAAATVGATTPFTSFEAEDGRVDGGAAIRSMTTLTDPVRGMIQPSRIRLYTVTLPGTFRNVYAALPGSLIPVEEAAIVNGIELEENVMKGQWLKVADRPKRPQ